MKNKTVNFRFSAYSYSFKSNNWRENKKSQAENTVIPNQVNELLNSPKTFPLPLLTTKQPPDFFFPLPCTYEISPFLKRAKMQNSSYARC